MNEKTLEFVKSRLKQYYERRGARAPREIERREFGFGNDKKIDYRHISFKNENELKKHLVDNVPLYASFSSAYYEFPEGRPMERKNFLGADLIFEFDAECTHGSVACEKCIDSMKNDTIRLIEEFLVPDFGFDKKDIRVTFSGSRGFHIFVENEAVRPLNAVARREIVDYVQGNGFDFARFLKEKPSLDAFGWKGRLARAALQHALKSEEKRFSDKMAVEEKIRAGNFDFFRGAPSAWEKILNEAKLSLNADIDQSVTLDLSRLIRLPSTVHGGSSLLCDYVKDIGSFNPFRDSVVFSDQPVKISLNEDVSGFALKEASFGPFKKSEAASVPEYAAMLLACKGKAEVNG
ncbi:MAG: DNA primase catalytic subunit PriS [archaeon]